MFQRARRRLTILYIILIALVLGIFSVVFYVAFRAVLGPAFDIAPDLSTAQAAEAAYHQALERVAIALVLANVLMVGLVGTAAWVLANRTLRPIRDAHERQRRSCFQRKGNIEHRIEDINRQIKDLSDQEITALISLGKLGEVAGSTLVLFNLCGTLDFIFKDGQRFRPTDAYRVPLSQWAKRAAIAIAEEQKRENVPS